MDETTVRFEDVWRSFGGRPALEGLAFTVPRGSITALLGPNGAGKTTALKCLVGLLRPDRGRITVLGREVGRLDARTREALGYLSERQALDPRLTVRQLIEFARALNPRWDDALAADLLRRLELPPGATVGALSQGGARKLGLLIALAPRPELLVLDEPAANLDAAVRREFLETVLDLFRGQGMTVLLSTHLLHDVERLADRVALLEAGRLRVEDTLDGLKERVKAIRVIGNGAAPLPPFRVPGLLRERRAGREALLTIEGFDERTLPALREQTAAALEVVDLPLEDIFIAYASAPREASF
jgi:ABC-2 type transport system ATP-binding protein